MTPPSRYRIPRTAARYVGLDQRFGFAENLTSTTALFYAVPENGAF
jgi:hypothetical protein